LRTKAIGSSREEDHQLVRFCRRGRPLLRKLDSIREWHKQSTLYQSEPNAFDGLESCRAVALTDLYRRVFQNSSDSGILSKSMDLESLVLSASLLQVSNSRDTIYALLYLANDRHPHGALVSRDNGNRTTMQELIHHIDKSTPFHTSATKLSHHVLTADYSRHPVDIFTDFVRYCIERSQSLDIICRP
jgi:hypothetical protein